MAPPDDPAGRPRQLGPAVELWRMPPEERDAQDDCLIAITDSEPIPAGALGKLPPWRAVMIARVAELAGVPLERGTVAQLADEARAAGGSGKLGAWWDR